MYSLKYESKIAGAGWTGSRLVILRSDVARSELPEVLYLARSPLTRQLPWDAIRQVLSTPLLTSIDSTGWLTGAA
jgi:hypothetical protein